jgi:hypothetical protein
VYRDELLRKYWGTSKFHGKNNADFLAVKSGGGKLPRYLNQDWRLKM